MKLHTGKLLQHHLTGPGGDDHSWRLETGHQFVKLIKEELVELI